MGVIIGSGVTVSFYGACAISANWGYNPNTQRFYCLGETSPRFIINKPTETLSIAIYSGTGGPGSFSTVASEDCNTAAQLTASVTAVDCAGGSVSLVGQWFPNSYGYSKDDPNLPGQETWGMMRWVRDDATGTEPPDRVIRGVSEGQGTYLPEDADPGIDFDPGTTAESNAGNASAGSIGRNDALRLGTVISLYGGEGVATGKTGQGSSSIPYTPLWI